MAELAVSLMT
jgi:hypothetical protein